MDKKTIVANCRSQVIAKINCFLPSVPDTLDERKKWQREWFCIEEIFEKLPEDQFNYPIKVTNRESPDFVLSMPDRKVGIECVECVNEAYMAARRDLEKSGQYPKIYQVPHIPSGIPKREGPELARKQMIFKVLRPPTHRGESEHESEQEWIIAINKILDKKKIVFENASFSKYDDNWLFIKSNYRLDNVNIDFCMNAIINYINCNDINSRYNRIIIWKSNLIYSIERINGVLGRVIYS